MALYFRFASRCVPRHVGQMRLSSMQSWTPTVTRMPNVPMKTPGDIIGEWQPATPITDKELFYNSVFLPQFFPEPRIEPLPEMTEEPRGAPKLAVKRTFQPSVIRRKRKHGFLARVHSKKGRQIINRRRAKGRHNLSA